MAPALNCVLVRIGHLINNNKYTKFHRVFTLTPLLKKIRKVNSRKINYFLMFHGIMKNKLENIFQYLVMLWKMN